jgi:DNA replication protein DnaC
MTPDEQEAWRRSPEGQAAINAAWPRAAREMGVDKIFIEPSFPSESKPETIVRAYMESDYRRGACLVLAGSVGCGKTTAAVGALRTEFQKRYDRQFSHYSRRLWHARKLESDLLSHVNFGADRKEALQLASCHTLIILDDLGTEVAREVFQADLDLIIGAREANRRPTIITTNLAGEDLKARYSLRIVDRLRGWGRIVEIHGKSFRGREKPA